MGKPMTTELPAKIDQVPNGCWVACIATLTGLPHDELAAFIPADFLQDGSGERKWPEYHNSVSRYLREHGWRLAYVGPDCPRGWSIMSGMGPRGHVHSTVAFDGALWHDPHPSRDGLTVVDDYEVLIPIRPIAADPEEGAHG